MSQPPKPIQRTLIITAGNIASTAATYLAEWLEQDRLPSEAVAILQIAQEKSDLDSEVLMAALRQISQLTSRSQLAERGWLLDRLNEIAVFLILDKEAPWTDKRLKHLVNHLDEAVRREVGVETAVQLIILT